MYADEDGDYVRYEDAQQEIDRIKAKIAELKAAAELYESANTGPEYSFAHQKYQEAVKELFVELEGK